MKIYTLPAHENWVLDRLTKEWHQEHLQQSIKVSEKEKIIKNQEFEIVLDPRQSDLIWIMADWCWKRVDQYSLVRKKVITTVCHIVPEKFGDAAKKEFEMRDQFVDAYHVICDLTMEQIKPLTNKPIYSFPFWVNQNIWHHKNKDETRQKYNVSSNKFLIGSFQRDTEGNSISSGEFKPKLEKGPDIFCDIVENLHKLDNNIEVILAGWRRQYVMGRLDKAGIKYHYIELPNIDFINDLYNIIDLYIVGARYEGGPQSLFECAATKTPIISTTVGYSPELFDERCLIEEGASYGSASDDKTLSYNYDNVKQLFIPRGMEKFHDMMRKVMIK